MYTSCPDTCQSVGGQTVILEGAPVVIQSHTTQTLAMLSTEAELISATECAQDMLYVMQILEVIGLRREETMTVEVDNGGTIGIANSWSVGGQTRHIETRYYLLRKPKEQGVINTVWKCGLDMPSDLLTKNLARPLFEHHLITYCGNNEYYAKKVLLIARAERTGCD